MAIFNRVGKEEFGTIFKHKGWYLFCPVYIGDVSGGAYPVFIERNWVPEWVFEAADSLFGFLTVMAQFADPLHEPAFPLLVTGDFPDPEAEMKA